MDIHYLLEPTPDRLYTCLATVKHILATSQNGHVLIFETGEREVEAVCEAIRWNFRSVNVIPLYSLLPDGEQELAFAPSRIRKCIVATNMAESSVLSYGVRFVIDSGLHKQLVYNPRARMQMLQTVPISQQAAVQRSGGSSSLRPGVCYRLYTEEEHNWLMPEKTRPAIMNEDPAAAILGRIGNGHTDVLAHDWKDRPTPEGIFDALERLNE